MLRNLINFVHPSIKRFKINVRGVSKINDIIFFAIGKINFLNINLKFALIGSGSP